MSTPEHEARCSFCNRAKDEVDVLVAGKHAHICNNCVALCNAEAAPLAHCFACTPVDGRHARGCSEGLIA